MQASPICIPTVSSDIDWDFCFHLSQQAKIPAYQRREELCSSSGSGESEEDTTAKEEKTTVCVSLPKEKLAQSQKKIAQLIKKKMNTQANKELIRCVILSRIIFGEEHWKCAQAAASLAYGYLTLRGLPAQAKKHAESAKNTLLTWKGSRTSNKEKKEILEALVMLYYTLGVAWLLQNRGREAYFNLQKAERNMKELKELFKGSVRKSQVSEKDLTIALGRASLAIHRLNLALAYFEKAIGDVIAAKGDKTLDLVSLYEEIAQIEQLRRNHDGAIQYLQQAYSICVSLFTEVSPQTAEASALLAKAHAMSGEAQHRDAVEIYFIKSINAYQATLGPTGYETLTTIEEFCKWLVQNGEKQCLMIQILLYGSEHSKSRDTRDLLNLLQRFEITLSLGLLRRKLKCQIAFCVLCSLLLLVKRKPPYKIANNKANLLITKILDHKIDLSTLIAMADQRQN
ncbi:tetratricopeptide repeat protein 23-like [Neomonachus schauinslandi]|uniref:Tetratricopeptide repeat protein 23-like n=1 Tax=Neomonachus schauinslandi TaxID=29088 RepID=A0A8M1MFI4_NEOSC|nr:tetratricopeptide repeat protein 23-like [Neomonachus schauinslandi]